MKILFLFLSLELTTLLHATWSDPGHLTERDFWLSVRDFESGYILAQYPDKELEFRTTAWLAREGFALGKQVGYISGFQDGLEMGRKR